MANEALTIDTATAHNMKSGLRLVIGTVSGPALVDATNLNPMDMSGYGETCHGISFNGVTAAADALIRPEYVSADMVASTALVSFSYATGDAGVGAPVSEDTVLSGYQWYFTAYMSGTTV